MTLPNIRSKQGTHWFNKKFVIYHTGESVYILLTFTGEGESLDGWIKQIKTSQLFTNSERMFSSHSICPKKSYMKLKYAPVSLKQEEQFTKLHVLDIYTCAAWSIICWDPCKDSHWFQLDHTTALLLSRHWEIPFSWDGGKKGYSYLQIFPASHALCKSRSPSKSSPWEF